MGTLGGPFGCVTTRDRARGQVSENTSNPVKTLESGDMVHRPCTPRTFKKRFLCRKIMAVLRAIARVDTPSHRGTTPRDDKKRGAVRAMTIFRASGHFQPRSCMVGRRFSDRVLSAVCTLMSSRLLKTIKRFLTSGPWSPPKPIQQFHNNTLTEPSTIATCFLVCRC